MPIERSQSGVKGIFMDPTRTLPWVEFMPQEEISLLKERPQLLLIKMLAKVTLQAFDAYNKGTYEELDALIGNSGCETHAFNILSLAHSQGLQAEIDEMHGKFKGILEDTVTKMRSKSSISYAEFYNEMQQIRVSEQMLYLIYSRLLTITKTPDGEKTDANLIISKLGRDLNKLSSLLNKIVLAAQVQMSRLSIAMMAAKLNESSLADRLVIKMLSKECLFEYTPVANKPAKLYSSCYYNTKAILLLATELNTPLVFKRMTKKVDKLKTLLFRPTGTIGKFEILERAAHATPVIVCDVVLPEDDSWTKEAERLGEMILIDASHEGQYLPAKPEIKVADQEALHEIETDHRKTAPFHIDHFYCTTWRVINP